MAPVAVIGIDGSRALRGDRTGTENYSFELLRAMAEMALPDDIRVYLNAESCSVDKLPGEPVCIPLPRLWTHARLSYEMLRHRPDLLFVPSHVVPLIHPRSVVTIHDVGYLREPASYPAKMLRQLRWSTTWSVSRAAHVIAPSESTKRDLVDLLEQDPDRITVIPHGVSDRFASRESTGMQASSDKSAPFILTVGTIQPRKNLGVLLSAFDRLADLGLPHRLVIAGNRGWLSGEFDAQLAVSKWRRRVDLLGFVADSDLPSLYRRAALFCLPSLYEGFGMPVLEAMASGTPVIVSNRGALPEVAGDAALSVDPLDVNALTNAMRRCLDDVELSESLVMRGMRRAAEFSWERSAAETLTVLRYERDR